MDQPLDGNPAGSLPVQRLQHTRCSTLFPKRITLAVCAATRIHICPQQSFPVQQTARLKGGSPSEVEQASPAVMAPKPDHDAVVKLLLIGDCGAGKTSLMTRFARNAFDADVRTTIGIDFTIRKMMVSDKLVKIHVWDTSGQHKFRTIINEYFRGVEGILLVYDITNESTFESIRDWMEQTQKHAPDHVVKAIVGNKLELASKRAVSYERGKALADGYGVQFFETSAESGSNVEEVFTTIIKKALPSLLMQDGTSSAKKQGSDKVILVGQNAGAQKQRSRCCFCF